MSIQAAALILLAMRSISTIFLVITLFYQLPLMRAKDTRLLHYLRIILMAITLTLLVGNVVPIIVDALTVFSHLERSTSELVTLSVAYTFSNATVSVASAMGIWAVYYVISKDNERYK